MRSLRRAILAGDIAVGERLPSERELAEKLQVNRATVRSALEALRVEGLVYARPGSGYVVQNYKLTSNFDILPGLLEVASRERKMEFARDILLLRRTLAILVLEALTRNIDPRGQLHFAVQVERLAALVDSNAPLPLIAETDVDVAQAVVAATGSEMLSLGVNPILVSLTRFPLLRDVIYSRSRHIVERYRKILAWLNQKPSMQDMPVMIRHMEERDQETLALLAQQLVG